MARVVVVGGGFGGMAAAARLARLGHEVTLLERAEHLGGALHARSAHDDFAWDAGPTTTLLPAVVRDLFRKSGRPLERELDLQPLDLVREHRFEDGSAVRLPGGSRAAQLAAFERSARASAGSGSTTSASYADRGSCCAEAYFERPCDPDVAPRELAGLLDRRECCTSGCSGRSRTSGCGCVAGHPFVVDGHDLRNVPGAGRASTSTSSSASARGPSPAGSPPSARRWPTASRPAASPC